MGKYTLNVNGASQTVVVESDTPLLWVLRDTLNLTGTKFGCGMALCGACTVHLDGQPVRSCSTPISEAEGKAITTIEGVRALKPKDAIHETLGPIYETVRILARELPRETTLIGFAGAPWTVATYMIAGRGTKDQGPAHALKAADRATFSALIDVITEATIDYLSAQVTAGAEVVKLFDSWAGSLKGQDFTDFAVKPAARIISALKAMHPGLPVIAFPREGGDGQVRRQAAWLRPLPARRGYREEGRRLRR